LKTLVFVLFLNHGREAALQQLSEIQVAPSVGLHDVPRESVGQHLGLISDDGTPSVDELDDRLARKFPNIHLEQSTPTRSLEHGRYVYHLQEVDAREPESDESEDFDSHRYDSADSTASRSRQGRLQRSRQRKRMSIMSNEWYEVPQLNHFGRGNDENVGNNKSGRLRFFDSGLRWDVDARRIVPNSDIRLGVKNLMERNGLKHDVMDMEEDCMEEEEG
jgi:histone deacetylase 1/2